MNLPPVLKQRYFDADGEPLAGGKLYTYQSGTTTPQATYTDQAGGTPNANPIVLDANGECSMWLNPDLTYKFVLKDSDDVTQWTVDNVVGLLAPSAVNTASIADEAVTTAKIDGDAVTGAKIADNAVGIEHLNDTVSGPGDIKNLKVVCSVGSNALTIALKTKAGTDPSATDPITVCIPNSDGTYAELQITAATSFVFSSGSTIGHTNGVAWDIYGYFFNDSGTLKIGFSSTLFGNGILSASAEGGAGAADSFSTIYATAAITSKQARVFCKINSTQATAGTWASAPTDIRLWPMFDYGSLQTMKSGSVRVLSASITFSAGTPSVADEDGDWVSSLTDHANGDTTVTVQSGVFSSSTPKYHVTTHTTGNGVHAVFKSTGSATGIRVETENSSTGGDQDVNFYITAIGAR